MFKCMHLLEGACPTRVVTYAAATLVQVLTGFSSASGVAKVLADWLTVDRSLNV